MSRVGNSLRVADARSATGLALRRRIAGRLDSLLGAAVERAASRIVRDVRRGGERALLALVREHDGVAAGSLAELRLRPLPGDESWRSIDAATRDAIDVAIDNVETFHRAAARSTPPRVADGGLRGVVVEEIVRPLARVGVYVPGGRASYPSTAIMTVVPARVAGVGSIAVATPAASWAASPALRYALDRLGVEEVWGIGGAQAIAALAFGCGALRRVDAIVGPGNAWVTAAKRRVAGQVAIDGLMGPSEVVIVADAGADPELVAADLLAQAEHDPGASALLATRSRALARSVAAAVERRLADLSTAATARESLRRFGGALLVPDIDAAIELVAELAPEHLQLVGAEAEGAAERFTVAGAIFVGAETPEVFGDYVAGPSHVLPTCGTARFASGLSVSTFERRTHRLRVTDPDTARAWGAAAAALARAEGLPAHAAAAGLRADGGKDARSVA